MKPDTSTNLCLLLVMSLLLCAHKPSAQTTSTCLCSVQKLAVTLVVALSTQTWRQINWIQAFQRQSTIQRRDESRSTSSKSSPTSTFHIVTQSWPTYSRTVSAVTLSLTWLSAWVHPSSAWMNRSQLWPSLRMQKQFAKISSRMSNLSQIFFKEIWQPIHIRALIRRR